MALGGRGDVLVAVIDHAHRVTRLARQQRRVDRHDRGVLLLAAKAATSLGLDHDRLAVAQGERPLERRMDVVGTLERAVHGDPTIVARDRRSCPGSRCTAAPGGRRDRSPRRPGPRWPAPRPRPRYRPRSERTRGRTGAGRARRAGLRSAAARRRLAARSSSRSGAAMSATGSAWWRISSVTSTGWSDWMDAMTFSPGISAAATTTTCDQSNPGSRSRPRNRA